jgi:hypothetical protein
VKAALPTTIYLRQAGLTCSPKFCYLYSVSCWGQDAVSNSRPIANIHVGRKPFGTANDRLPDYQSIYSNADEFPRQMKLQDLRIQNDQPNEVLERDCLIKADSHPYIVYKVLKNQFGTPNNLSVDDDRVKWSYSLSYKDILIDIYDWKQLSCSIVIYSINRNKLESEKLASLINNLISHEGKKYQRELKEKVKNPSARIIQNPFQLYFSTAKSLKTIAMELSSNKNDNGTFDFLNQFQIFSKHFDVSRSAFLMYLSSFEGFLNLMYELHIKKEYKDERIFNTINRLQIDLKLRMLPTYCNGFKNKLIDDSDDRFKNYLRLVNLRNDFVHANFIKSEERQVIQVDDLDFIYLNNSDDFIPKDFSQISIEHLETTEKCIIDATHLVFESMRPSYARHFIGILGGESIQIDES